MVDLIHVHFADDVERHDERLLGAERGVAAVEEAEVAVLEEQHDGVGVVGFVLGLRLGLRGEGVFAALVGARGDDLLIRAEDAEVELRVAGDVRLDKRDGVAGLDGDALLHLGLAVGLAQERPAQVLRVAVGAGLGEALVVERADGHEGSELRRAAEVVNVEVRDDDMVNALQARDFGGELVDAPGVAPAGIAGVNEHGLALRRDDERGATAFRVHPVDVEGFVGLARASSGGGKEQHSNEKSRKEDVHGGRFCGTRPLAATGKNSLAFAFARAARCGKLRASR